MFEHNFVCSLGNSYPTTNKGTMLNKYLTQAKKECSVLTQSFPLLPEE